MKLTRITPPDPLLDLQTVKNHLRVEHSEDDALIQTYMAAAVGYVDGNRGILGRQLMPARYRGVMPDFPSRAFCLPLPPTVAVHSISYLDTAGAEVVLDPSVYRVTGLAGDEGAVVVLGAAQTWPTVYSEADWPDRVFIEFTAGYENPDSPADHPDLDPVRQALLLLIGDWYETRTGAVVGTSVQEMPTAVMALLAPYRLYIVAEGC